MRCPHCRQTIGRGHSLVDQVVAFVEEAGYPVRHVDIQNGLGWSNPQTGSQIKRAVDRGLIRRIDRGLFVPAVSA